MPRGGDGASGGGRWLWRGWSRDAARSAGLLLDQQGGSCSSTSAEVERYADGTRVRVRQSAAAATVAMAAIAASSSAVHERPSAAPTMPASG